MNRLIVGVAGNPNCGKTTLFNVLTGTKQQVGNWPGVTVDKKIGHYRHHDCAIELVDLPGIYSLDTTPSLDEQITQHYLLSGEVQLILNIVDASNLERNLYLTTQLVEMGIPLLLALNMIDVAEQRHLKIDLANLSQQLGITIIPISAAKKLGIEALKNAINQIGTSQPLPNLQIPYPKIIQEALTKLYPILLPTMHHQTHWVSLKLLENDYSQLPTKATHLTSLVKPIQQAIQEKLAEDPDILIAESRYEFISTIVPKSVTTPKLHATHSDKIDQLVLHRFLGIPIFLFLMYLMFIFTIHLGGAFVDFFDILGRTLLVTGLGDLLTQLGTPVLLTTLLAEGLGGGIQIVATFIPIIGCLFLFLTFLEDSGYLARAAFVMDRFTRCLGLPGKSFVPLIVGFGCNVPAIMASRILENPRDRRLTILMTPFMSCGARLAIYALFTVAFFPSSGPNLLFILYLVGILAAIVTGLILKNTLLQGETLPFLMELPSYRLPTLQNLQLHTWERLKSFLFNASQLIVPMVMILTFLNSWSPDGRLVDNHQQSILTEIGRTVTPLFEPIGVTADNWPATVGLFTGVLAKEAVVGTLNTLYNKQDILTPKRTITAGITEAFATIPHNLSEVAKQIIHPLGLSSSNKINQPTLGAMVTHFDGQRGAFAYLLFILLYFPCIATLAAIYRETNLKWTLFVVFWNTALAYLVAVTFYQITTITEHPWTSVAWIGGLATLFILTLLILTQRGRQVFVEKPVFEKM